MKKTLLLFGLVTGSFIYAQNVGIETDNPQYTLDVEGSVRLSEPGEFVVNSKPLGINNETKQVVALEVSDDGDPFHVRRRVFPYSGGTGLANYDLGVNIDTHDVMLVGVSLVFVDRNGNIVGAPNIAAVAASDRNVIQNDGNLVIGGSASFDSVLTPLILQKKPKSSFGGTGVRVITEPMSDGKHHMVQGSMTGGVDYPRNTRNIHQTISYSKLTATVEKGLNNNWFFRGGTQISTLVETRQALWVVDMLIINKNWVDSRDIVEVNVGRDFKTLTKVRGTHPAVQ